MTVAKEKGIRLCGGSTCVATEQTVALANTVREQALGRVFGGSLACPVYMDSPYGGIWFYAQHLVEVMTTVFGTNVQAVQAKRTGDTLTFLARYPEFTVSGTFAEALRYYHVTVYGAQGVQQETLQLTPDSFRHEMDAMLHLLRGGEMEKGYAEFVVPVYIISAILRSVESGCWETFGQADV
jgi:hypothetical protein